MWLLYRKNIDHSIDKYSNIWSCHSLSQHAALKSLLLSRLGCTCAAHMTAADIPVWWHAAVNQIPGLRGATPRHVPPVPSTYKYLYWPCSGLDPQNPRIHHAGNTYSDLNRARSMQWILKAADTVNRGLRQFLTHVQLLCLNVVKRINKWKNQSESSW